jgi:hypothetical protein
MCPRDEPVYLLPVQMVEADHLLPNDQNWYVMLRAPNESAESCSLNSLVRNI